MKTWKPDTCECHLEELYDGREIIGMGKVLKKCDAHVDVPDEELYGVIMTNTDSEQRMKNETEALLLGLRGVEDTGLTKEVVLEDGSKGKVWKDGAKYEWHFTGTGKNRKFHVDTDLEKLVASKSKVAEIAARTATIFGEGKIDVVKNEEVPLK